MTTHVDAANIPLPASSSPGFGPYADCKPAGVYSIVGQTIQQLQATQEMILQDLQTMRSGHTSSMLDRAIAYTEEALRLSGAMETASVAPCLSDQGRLVAKGDLATGRR